MFRFLSTIVKIGLASLITGAVLTKLDLSAETVLLELGLTPEAVMTSLQNAVQWALPNIILGSMVIVPVWIVVYLFRPPRS